MLNDLMGVQPKHKKSRGLLKKLNTRLLKVKLKDQKEDKKTRNSPLFKPMTFNSKNTRLQTITPTPTAAKDTLPSSECSALPPLPSSGAKMQKLTSFVHHRKNCYTSVLKWDPKRKMNVPSKIWLKPENNFRNIMKTPERKIESDVIMMTFGRTPKQAHKRSQSDVFDFTSVCNSNTPLNSTSGHTFSSYYKVSNHKRTSSDQLSKGIDGKAKRLGKNGREKVTSSLKLNLSRPSLISTNTSPKVKRIEKICQILLDLKDVKGKKLSKKFDNFGFDPNQYNATPSKEDSLSTKIIKLRKRRAREKKESLASTITKDPLRKAKLKFKQLFQEFRDH
ncbi:unnamed protein product [Moneuplotes crassus]|uniref:Uncharacterized protein n=1 Tax=Euplotes crassus TaxID=5936 RepID=A0AAD1U0X7_EUPCR|nr:unnamed protein product [Moneuplotes crassus]